jgi:hypothetical protein
LRSATPKRMDVAWENPRPLLPGRLHGSGLAQRHRAARDLRDYSEVP